MAHEEHRGYNVDDPRMPFCPDDGQGAKPIGAYTEALKRRMDGTDACELRELDLARGTARRLRAELIYGMPAAAQVYEEHEVPTSLNLPLFMEFLYEVLTGKPDPGPRWE